MREGHHAFEQDNEAKGFYRVPKGNLRPLEDCSCGVCEAPDDQEPEYRVRRDLLMCYSVGCDRYKPAEQEPCREWKAVLRFHADLNLVDHSKSGCAHFFLLVLSYAIIVAI